MLRIEIHPAKRNRAQLGSIMLPADGPDSPTYYGPPITDISEGDMPPSKYDLPANPADQVDSTIPILAIQPQIVPMPLQVPDDLYPDIAPVEYGGSGEAQYSDYQEVAPIKTIGFGFYDANGNPVTQDPGPAYLACDEGTVHQWNKDGTQECIPIKDTRFLGPPIQADPNIVPVDPYSLPANPDNNVDTPANPSGTIQTLTPSTTAVVPVTTTPATTTTTTTPAATAAAADDDTKLWGIPKTYLWWGGGIALALFALSQSSGGGTAQ